MTPAVNHAHAGSRRSIDDGGGVLNHPLSFSNLLKATTLSQVLDCWVGGDGDLGGDGDGDGGGDGDDAW